MVHAVAIIVLCWEVYYSDVVLYTGSSSSYSPTGSVATVIAAQSLL